MNRETFLRKRKGGIGGSDIGSICGLNPYPDSTAWKVWMDKTGRGAPWQGNHYTRYGQAVEPAIAALYAEEMGVEVYESDIGPSP